MTTKTMIPTVTITVHHTAFARSSDFATRKFTTTGTLKNAESLMSDIFAATNAPRECMSPAQQVLADHQVKSENDLNRCYSTSVGDLVEIEDTAGHHSLHIVAGFGFRTLADKEDGQDVRREFIRLVGKFENALEFGGARGFFDQLSTNKKGQ